MNIDVSVREKVAEVIGSPVIVCGNSDYTVHFYFDNEWDAYPEKTAYFVYCVNGARKYKDVQFTGNTVSVPVLYNTHEVEIGVCAGDIRTTTGARVQCSRCITDGAPQHDPPAQDVYKDILDRLDKLEQSGGVGGGGSSRSQLIGIQTVHLHGGQGTISGGIRYTPPTRWSYWQETNDDPKTASTVIASPTEDCLLLAAVMHRDAVTIDGDGWEQVAVSQEIQGGSSGQWITVWAKHVTAGEYPITAKLAAEARMSLKAIALYQADRVTVAQSILIADTSALFTPLETTGKRRLYLLSSTLAADPNIAIAAVNTGTLDLQHAGETRFSAFYDYQPEQGVTPSFGVTFGGPYTPNSVGLLTLDIEEEL